MRRKTVILILLSLCLVQSAFAWKPKLRFKPREKAVTESVSLYPDEYLDTVNVDNRLVLNDYPMIGFEYGVSRNSQLFTPAFRQNPVFFPEYFGITYTQYGKLIGSPFVGFQIGAFYGHEGYEFKINEKTGGVFVLNEATRAEMDYAEIPLLAMGHYDFPNFKIQMGIGPYAGYRLSIHRSGPFIIDPNLENDFDWFEKRWDYGLHGGVGFGIIVDPVEFQVNLRVRYSWSSLWAPNYNSEYYYRYAYPFDFMLTGGLHIHLGRRYGKTNRMIRHEAREAVYNPPVPEDEQQ